MNQHSGQIRALTVYDHALLPVPRHHPDVTLNPRMPEMGGLAALNAIRADIAQLRATILAYVEAHNERDAPLKCVKAADEILDSMRRFGLGVQQVHAQ
jgi:CheY-like chemotaxis protein